MKVVVFQDLDGTRLAFMLCSHDLTEPSGDCLFMGVPGEAEPPDSLATHLLAERMQGVESAWDVSRSEALAVVVRTPGLQDELFVEFGPYGTGLWGVGAGADRQVAGLASLPPGH